MYFKSLIAASWSVMNKLPLQQQPSSIDEISGALSLAATQQRSDFLKQVTSYNRDCNRRENNCAIGLNTVGMLSDRLTILSIKHWFLRTRYKKNDEAEKLEETQISELIRALETARPGHSSTNNKLTNLDVRVEGEGWDESFYGLFKTNLLLWESQEVLYTRGANSLPDDELRKYINYFAHENLARNKYIERCEQAYWTK